jgi:hypothetical protein
MTKLRRRPDHGVPMTDADAATAAQESPDSYRRNVARGLDRAFDDPATEELSIDLERDRLVVFSDHHKGARDGADDFWRCERAYHGALGHYLEAGHRLLVLGDVEELWECTPESVIGAYRETLALESRFHAEGRYVRFWGNHDDQWRYESQVAKHLHPVFPGLRVHEALKLRITMGGEPLGLIFLAHGHQGTAESDRFSWLSRLVVRYLWRPLQRRLNIASTTPAQDYELRQRHDAAMFVWARSHPERPVLIAGHTHRPIFGTSRPLPEERRSAAEVARELDEARGAGAGTETLARLRAELEFLEAEPRRGGPPRLPIDPPCYFNTGCCSFGDGDVTGIEIAGGRIRLVRWPDDAGDPVPKVLVEDELEAILRAVGS